MSKDLNETRLIGRLGKDPELKYTQGGVALCRFTLATNRVWRTKDGEDKAEVTWHNILVWNAQAETCAKYLHKGSRIYLAGRIANGTYEKADGSTGYSSEVVMDDLIMLDAAPAQPEGKMLDGEDDPERAQHQREKASTRAAAVEKRAQTQPKSWAKTEVMDDGSDDLPF